MEQEEIFKTKEVKLSQDKKDGKVKETKVTLPTEFVKIMDINPKKNRILWILGKNEDGLNLTGFLIGIKDGKENKN